MPRTPCLAALFSLTLLVACAAPPEPIRIDTRAVVATLAADELEGRLTGTDGIRMAADYIVEQLRAIGATPLPGADDFRLPFEFTAGLSDGGSRLTVAGRAIDAVWQGDAMRALSFSENGSVTSGVVFAGYGLSVPETDGFSYDSYSMLDVTDKIVLILRYFPEDTEGELRGRLSRYSGLRFKALAARERGAKGLIVVTGPRSPNAGALVPMTFDTALAGSNIVAGTVVGEVAEQLVGLTGQSLEDVQASLDSGNPHVTGFEIPDVQVTLETTVNRERRTGYNVVGALPAASTAPDAEKPYVLLGGHYDHLGHGRGGNSLAREDEAGEIHNGADDNASGVAAILSAGARLAQMDRRRHVILALWAGEELGLLGSADFVDTSPVPIDQIAAYLNFDMVGRLTDNKLTVQAIGTSPLWAELLEELNGSLGFDLQVITDPYLPTDITSLNSAEVPSIGFFTGSHEDYHRPTDDAEILNYEGLDRIAELGTAIAERLTTQTAAPTFVRVEEPARQGSQAVMRIFTGTIPDYAQEAEGLVLSGVVGGGPAEVAGLRRGDVIVELGGHTIANIYDYTYALDLLRVGQPAAVVFMRHGERMEVELIPQAR